MKEAVGTVVCKPFGGSGFLQPAVELADGTWYWISSPKNDAESWPVDPGQRVRTQYIEGDQFCEVVQVVEETQPTRRVKVGAVVRYVRTIDPGDEDWRFVVIENNGVRLMIRLICDLAIPPVYVVPRCEVPESSQSLTCKALARGRKGSGVFPGTYVLGNIPDHFPLLGNILDPFVLLISAHHPTGPFRKRLCC